MRESNSEQVNVQEQQIWQRKGFNAKAAALFDAGDGNPDVKNRTENPTKDALDPSEIYEKWKTIQNAKLCNIA